MPVSSIRLVARKLTRAVTVALATVTGSHAEPCGAQPECSPPIWPLFARPLARACTRGALLLSRCCTLVCTLARSTHNRPSDWHGPGPGATEQPPPPPPPGRAPWSHPKTPRRHGAPMGPRPPGPRLALTGRLPLHAADSRLCTRPTRTRPGPSVGVPRVMARPAGRPARAGVTAAGHRVRLPVAQHPALK